jgi:membrane protein YqaA with SNARE-associated domain
MTLFTPLYDKVLLWAAHRHASWYLAGLSFSESSFFPIPPDVMLAPMALARRDRAWFYAMVTTLASVFGGVLGYLIGMLAFDSVEPWLLQLGYAETYQHARDWFEHWGGWVVFLAGFTPIPYKIFTISAGVTGMAFIPFVIASLIGRGARFFLLAGLIYIAGARMEHLLRQYIDRLGWLLIVLLLVGYVVYKNGS